MTFQSTLVASAIISLAMLMGCATDNSGITPNSQVSQVSQVSHTSFHSPATDPAVVTASYSADAQNSLISLEPGQDLAEIVRNAPGVVLIDFYATWCGPCVKQGQVLQELEPFASQRNAWIVKVDVDQHQGLAERFGVSSLPTLLLVKEGQIVERQQGLADATRISQLLRR